MKKTLLVAIVLSGMITAHAASVSSENIYGIINIPVIAGMNAIGVNLNGSDGETANINEIFQVDELTAAGTYAAADKLYIFSAGSYNTYWLDNNGETTTWTAVSPAPATPTVAPGSAMWIRADSAGTIYQLGTAATNASIDVTLTGGNNFIANPYPDDLDLTAFSWSGVTTKDTISSNSADLLRVWNGSSHTTYFYFESSNPEYSEATGWYETMTMEKATTILAGEGFWFYSRDESLDGTITITNPYSTL